LICKDIRQLINWATRGQVFPGSLQKFRAEFSEPIEKARNKDAPEHVVKRGNAVITKFQLMIAPYLLVRDTNKENLPRKDVYVVFTGTSLEQRRGIETYLKSGALDFAVGDKRRCPLAVIMKLRSICWHHILSTELKLDIVEVETLMKQSPKLCILIDLVREFKQDNNNRTLIFSQSKEYVVCDQCCQSIPFYL